MLFFINLVHTDTGKVMKVVFTADNTPVITEEISVSGMDSPKITIVIVKFVENVFHRAVFFCMIC